MGAACREEGGFLSLLAVLFQMPNRLRRGYRYGGRCLEEPFPDAPGSAVASVTAASAWRSRLHVTRLRSGYCYGSQCLGIRP